MNTFLAICRERPFIILGSLVPVFLFSPQEKRNLGSLWSGLIFYMHEKKEVVRMMLRSNNKDQFSHVFQAISGFNCPCPICAICALKAWQVFEKPISLDRNIFDLQYNELIVQNAG